MKSGVTIRPYRGSDKAAVEAMLLSVFRAGDTYTVDRDISGSAAVDYWTGGGRRVFVAEDGDAVLGTYYIMRNQGGGGSHVCNCGYVTADAARGRGIARMMLDHSLEIAPELGFSAMQFNFVVATNIRAIAIWERAGFAEVGRLPGAFEHPSEGLVDALVMYRRFVM